MPGQFEVMIERNFSSAHQLRGYRGKCENLHGHNYKIEIYARGSELNNIGLLVTNDARRQFHGLTTSSARTLQVSPAAGGSRVTLTSTSIP